MADLILELLYILVNAIVLGVFFLIIMITEKIYKKIIRKVKR